MARYMLLIYGNEQEWDSMTPEEERRLEDGHGAFVASAGSVVLDVNPLEPTNTATTLRGNSMGTPTTTDGPFLETKEALGGYYVVEAANLDEAIELARRLPELTWSHCSVEIRPIREVS